MAAQLQDEGAFVNSWNALMTVTSSNTAAVKKAAGN
jgi:hypothetical protein